MNSQQRGLKYKSPMKARILIGDVLDRLAELARKRIGNEVTFRLNAANVARHTLDRLDSFISAVDGQRLTYKRLTA